MEQSNELIAVKVQDKRHYERLTAFLVDHGFQFKSPFGASSPSSVWERSKEVDKPIRVLIADAEDDAIWHGDRNTMETTLKDWKFLSTTEFKERIAEAVSARSLKSLPVTYRLLKDSVEMRAGAVVELCDIHQKYSLITPERRVNPEADDAVFTDGSTIQMSRPTVEDQPEWWERVYQLNNYVTAEKYMDIQEQLKNGL